MKEKLDDNWQQIGTPLQRIIEKLEREREAKQPKPQPLERAS